MYESGFLDTLEPGTFKALSQIHHYLFGDIYEFAGKFIFEQESVTNK